MSIQMLVRTHLHIHAHIHIYLRIYTRTNVHVEMLIHTHTDTFISRHRHQHQHQHKHRNRHVYMYMYMYSHTHIHSTGRIYTVMIHTTVNVQVHVHIRMHGTQVLLELQYSSANALLREILDVDELPWEEREEAMGAVGGAAGDGGRHQHMFALKKPHAVADPKTSRRLIVKELQRELALS